MTAVTLFRWDDAGAPSIIGRKPSDILAIIQACLVDGYGTKSPLGWTREFENANANEAIYRNNVASGGSGGYVKFYPSSATDTAGKVLRFRSASGATGIDTLVNEAYQSVISVPTAEFTDWCLIGTPQAFYLIIKNPTANLGLRSNSSEQVFFCGDIKPYIPNDASRFIATGTPDFNADYTSETSGYYSQVFSYSWTRRSSVGRSSMTKLAATDGGGPLVDYGLLDGNHCVDEYIRSRKGQKKGCYIPAIIAVKSVRTSDYVSTDPDGVKYGDSVRWPLWRGELPGFVTEVFCSLESANWPHTDTHLGAVHWALSASGTAITQWINTEDWS